MARYEPRFTRDTARYSTPTKPAHLQPTPTRAIQRDLIQRLLADPTQTSPETLQLLRESQGEAFVRRHMEHPTTPTTPTSDLNSFLTQISTNRAKMTIQPKLTVTPAGDQYEQEADAVAAQVVQQINAPTPVPAAVQRDHEDDKDKLQMMRIQRQTGDVMGGLDVDTGVESRIQAARGGGSPIAEGSRSKLESAFGADFSGVRVHTDSESDVLNRSVQARAFTTGQDIFFRQGEYNPGSSDGQKLLAHELTHVVQQKPSAIGTTNRIRRAAISGAISTRIQRVNRGETPKGVKYNFDDNGGSIKITSTFDGRTYTGTASYRVLNAGEFGKKAVPTPGVKNEDNVLEIVTLYPYGQDKQHQEQMKGTGVGRKIVLYIAKQAIQREIAVVVVNQCQQPDAFIKWGFQYSPESFEGPGSVLYARAEAIH